MTTEAKDLMEYAIILEEKEISRDCKDRKHNNKEKNVKAVKAIVGEDDDNLVLCLLTIEINKENVKKRLVCGRC